MVMICYNFLGQCVHNMRYWSEKASEREPRETRGAPRTLSPLNEFFLVLCRVTRARFGILFWTFTRYSFESLLQLDKFNVRKI